MDRTTNPRGLGSKSFNKRPVVRPLLLLSPISDHEHISDLLDKYEIERISKELEHYIQEEAAKSTDVKSNGLVCSGHRSALRRVMSMPRLPPEGHPSGCRMNKTGEKKSKEIIKASISPARHTSGGGGGLRKKSEAKSKETIEVSRPERETGSGGCGGGMKIEKRRKEIVNGCFWLKLASKMCNSSESHLVEFGSDFLRSSGNWRKF